MTLLAVAEQLHLDVPPALDVPLQVHPRVAERGPRLRARHRDRLRRARPGRGPPAARARRRRPAALTSTGYPIRGRQRRRPSACGTSPARQHRQPGGDGVLPRRQLVPGRLERLRVGPDEHDPGRRAGPGQPRVLRQEPVPRVHRVRPRGDGRARPPRPRSGSSRPPEPGPIADDPVREPRGQRRGVGLRHGEHGLDAEPPAGADHPDGDLPPVGDKHPPQHPPSAHRAVTPDSG